MTIDPTVAIGDSSEVNATQYSFQRHIVRTSDGTLHSFIQKRTLTESCGGSNLGGLLWFNSTDSGTTWTCRGQLDSSSIYFSSAVADASDNIYVVYSNTVGNVNGGSVVLYRKFTKGSGASWTMETAQVMLFDSATKGYSETSIEIQGSTRLWVTTRLNDNNTDRIAVYYSDGFGAAPTWTASSTTLATARYSQLVRFGSKMGVIYGTLSKFYWRFRELESRYERWLPRSEPRASEGGAR